MDSIEPKAKRLDLPYIRQDAIFNKIYLKRKWCHIK